VAGISLGFGYNNRIINSELESNYMGVVVMNADNNVQVERCVIVDCIVGIYIGGKDRNETKRNETKRNETAVYAFPDRLGTDNGNAVVTEELFCGEQLGSVSR
jgi:parallel beta-helix repeat protein